MAFDEVDAPIACRGDIAKRDPAVNPLRDEPANAPDARVAREHPWSARPRRTRSGGGSGDRPTEEVAFYYNKIGAAVSPLAGSFGFSVEREMKESGEKGGTADINIGVGELQECTISKSMDF